MSLSLSLTLTLLLVGAALGQNASNLNPTLKYTITNPPPGFEGKTYPFHGEFFEVDSLPLKMQYSQVYWQTMQPVPLPAEIVQRYENANIAITGFEVNVLRRNQQTGAEESVPAYQSYNHHYSPNLVSNAVALRLDANGVPMGTSMGHSKMLDFVIRDDVPAPPADAILNQGFVHGNGQEHRQIFHGAPPGYVQTIWSPGSFVFSPMQISTNDGTGRKGAGGMLPRISQSYAPADAPYSPLLECPCTTRITKQLGRVTSEVQGTCAKRLLQGDCFVSAANILGAANIRANTTVSSTSLPAGCVVARVAPGSSLFNVVFNTNSSSPAPCQGSAAPSRNNNNVNRLLGTQTDLVTLGLDIDGGSKMVNITLSGPAQYWFGVGFNATQMNNLPYTITVDGNGKVQERKLGDHAPGTELASSVTVLSSSVTQGVRTVVLQRALQGLTADHYTFSSVVGTINFINALGGTVEYAQHKQRGASSIDLFNADASPSCLCADGSGTINGIPYNGDCRPEPWSDLLVENNPTCQVSSYVGGLACCFHNSFLLDADQTPPAFVDEVFFRFRFYFEDYKPAVHKQIHHVEWSLNGCDSGAGGPNPYGCRHIEFDIVQGQGSSVGRDVQVLTSTFPAKGMLESSCSPRDGQCMDGSKVGPNGFSLIMAAAHCHAPNCLRQELLNVDTGEMLCAGSPVEGLSENVFDERGYIYVPPCTWGAKEDGFLPPPVLYLNTTLRMTAWYNSTFSHPGQMGIWQMKAAFN